MKDRLIDLCKQVREITRSNDQNKEIPDELVYELIDFFQKTGVEAIGKLDEEDKYQYVELVLVDAPALIDPYSKGLDIYEVSSPWHQLVPKENYVSSMVYFFVCAFKLIIDHPSDLLLKNKYLLLLRSLQSMQSSVHGNLPYLLDLIDDFSDQNTEFLRKIQWLVDHGDTRKIFVALNGEQLSQYLFTVMKNHRSYIRRISNPEKIAGSFHVLEKSLFVWFNSMNWKKSQSSERALLYRIVLDLGSVPISHSLFQYFCPDILICTVCQIVINEDTIDLKEKDLAVFQSFGVYNNPVVKQIIARFSGQIPESRHKQKRGLDGAAEEGPISAVKMRIDPAIPLDRFSIVDQFNKLHTQLLEVGLFSCTQRKLIYTPDMQETCIFTKDNFVEFLSIPGDRFKLLPCHIDVLQEIGQEFLDYYNKLIEYGICDQNPIVREHAFKWSRAMETFLAGPEFGVDFEHLCSYVLRVIGFLKHFGDMANPFLAEIHTSINDHLKRYQDISEKYASEFSRICDSSPV